MAFLNPEAQEYIPVSHRTTPYHHLQHYLPILSSNPPFYHPNPFYDFHKYSPFYSPPPPPLYTTTTHHIHQHPPQVAVAPPLSPVVEAPPPQRSRRRGGSRNVAWRCGFSREREMRFGGYERETKYFSNHEKNKSKWKVGTSSTSTYTRVLPNRPYEEVFPLKPEEGNTTVMIKNVPNKYTRELLIALVEHHCKVENLKAKIENLEEPIVSAFDFIYLPMDFGSGYNKGYAFINFTEPEAVWKFYKAFHKKPWDFFQSNKIGEIVCAKIQGNQALVEHFEKSTFYCESSEFLPICFSPPRDGSGEPVIRRRTAGNRIGKPQRHFSGNYIAFA